MWTAHLAEATPLTTRPARPGLVRGPAARRSSPRVLSAGARADEAFRVIALACLERLRLSGERLARTGDADALHQVRVALRQLRSALTIFAPVLADGRIARLRDELKWLSSTLNDARDLDVLIARMPQPPAALVEARQEASTDGMAALDSARSRRLLAELDRVAPGQPRLADRAAAPAPPAAYYAAHVLDGLRRKVRKRGRRLRELDDHGLHRLRIATKQLRYATEFFAALFPSEKAQRRAGRELQALRALQDGLGELQDRAVAPTLLERLDVPRASWPPLPARKRLLKDAARQYQAARDIKPFWR